MSHLVLLGYAQISAPVNVVPTVWSLDIELQFCLFAPFAILLLGRTTYRSTGRLALYGFAAAGLALLFTIYGLRPTTGTLPLYLGFFLCDLLTAHHGGRPTRGQAQVSRLGAALPIFLQHCLHLSRAARMPWILLMIVAVAAVSWLIYRYVDEPSERLRRAFVEARRTRTATAQPAATCAA